MAATLYVVPGSHPCHVAMRALELKGVAYERVDLLPVLHKAAVRRRFAGTTVPGLLLEGGERVQGSVRIVHRLDALHPDPPLLPREPEARADVERAEEWGDEVLQPLARRVAYAALVRAPGAMASFTVRARLPLGPRLQALAAPAVARIAGRVNGASDPTVQADLVNLPRHLDRVDRWIAQGVMGGEAPNAADLQVGASLRLLLAFGDVAPLIEPRPAARVARTQYPGVPGHVPAGTLPAGWLPA